MSVSRSSVLDPRLVASTDRTQDRTWSILEAIGASWGKGRVWLARLHMSVSITAIACISASARPVMTSLFYTVVSLTVTWHTWNWTHRGPERCKFLTHIPFKFQVACDDMRWLQVEKAPVGLSFSTPKLILGHLKVVDVLKLSNLSGQHTPKVINPTLQNVRARA